MTAVRRAPSRSATPARARSGAGERPAAPRPRLRVLDEAQLAARHRRRRVRVALAVASVIAVVGLFGIAVFHVMITQRQFRLEQLETQALQEQARYERLRLRVAELESPARIVAAAQERLGMVPPPGVRYLSPTGAAVDLRRPIAGESNDAGPQPEVVDDMTATTAGGWTTVKPHLEPRP